MFCVCVNYGRSGEIGGERLFFLFLGFSVGGIGQLGKFLLGKSLISAYIGLFSLKFPKEELFNILRWCSEYRKEEVFFSMCRFSLSVL